MQAIHNHDPQLQMPPKGKLPEDLIRDFTVWIADGAVDPREAIGPQLDGRHSACGIHYTARVCAT